MGEFSWRCVDCDLPILSEGPTPDDWCFKCEDQFTDKDGAVQRAHLLNVNGTVNTVEKYGGYGVFGDVDAHAWLARNNVEEIRVWLDDQEWVPSGVDDDDRHMGISMEYEKREKTFEEIDKMILELPEKKIKREDLWHHAKDHIKNPIKIICDACYKPQAKYGIKYDDYTKSRDHRGQGWTDSHETDVGWVCDGCYEF